VKRDGKSSHRELELWQNLVAGASAGLAYWLGFYPLDVIKTKMQNIDFTQRQSWWNTTTQIYRGGGLSAFARGVWPCAIRAIPACSFMFTTVDFIRNYATDSLSSSSSSSSSSSVSQREQQSTRHIQQIIQPQQEQQRQILQQHNQRTIPFDSTFSSNVSATSCTTTTTTSNIR
jgi:hypothetical protein